MLLFHVKQNSITNRPTTNLHPQNHNEIKLETTFKSLLLHSNQTQTYHLRDEHRVQKAINEQHKFDGEFERGINTCVENRLIIVEKIAGVKSHDVFEFRIDLKWYP